MDPQSAFRLLVLALGVDLLLRVGLVVASAINDVFATEAAGIVARTVAFGALLVVFFVIGRTPGRRRTAAGLVFVLAVVHVASEVATGSHVVAAAMDRSPLVAISWSGTLIGIVLCWGIARCSGWSWVVAIFVAPVGFVVAAFVHSTLLFPPSRRTSEVVSTAVGEVALAVSAWIQFAIPILAAVMVANAIGTRTVAGVRATHGHL